MGTVVNVFNSGACDLLHVRLHSSVNMADGSRKAESVESEVSDQLVWVPFVEEIVPDVDMSRREMLITPPKGLLDLNLRTDQRSKKERRQLVRHTSSTVYMFDDHARFYFIIVDCVLCIIML